MYINPYNNIKEGTAAWLQANFHTHAGTGTGTCGEHEINEVIKYYKMAGYDVLSISNHDLYSDLSEYQKEFDITLINGFEYSIDKHMLCIGGNCLILDTHQKTIDECNKQGGFVVLCHPKWAAGEYWPLKDIDAITGYIGVEIINTVIFKLSGTGLATEAWDYLLSQGKLVWGFGNDDFHRWYDMARAWNLIYAHKSRQKILEAVFNGEFYVSTGLKLSNFQFDQKVLKIKACSLNNYRDTFKYLFIGKDGEILKEQCGEHAEYIFNGSELYVRVQVISDYGAMLWTQPIYDENRFNKA